MAVMIAPRDDDRIDALAVVLILALAYILVSMQCLRSDMNRT